MENEDYEVQETPNRKGRDWNSKNFQVSGYGMVRWLMLCYK